MKIKIRCAAKRVTDGNMGIALRSGLETVEEAHPEVEGQKRNDNRRDSNFFVEHSLVDSSLEYPTRQIPSEV